MAIYKTEFLKEYERHFDEFVLYLIGSDFYESHFQSDSSKVKKFIERFLRKLLVLSFPDNMQTSDVRMTDSSSSLMRLFLSSGANDNFYGKVLIPLFHYGSVPAKSYGAATISDSLRIFSGIIMQSIIKEDPSNAPRLTFPPDLFHKPGEEKNSAARGFLDFLENYKFTLSGNMPDHKTQAMNPSLFSDIFELVLEERRGKGAVYTPEITASYMCKESIAAFLRSRLSMHDDNGESFDNDALRRFIEKKDASGFTAGQLKTLDSLLSTLTVCDPAAGTGIFLILMLNEILALKECIANAAGEKWNPAEVQYQIIRRSLYGIEIDEDAAAITRLRLQLSLLADDRKPEKLTPPNNNIRTANSLLLDFESFPLIMDEEGIADNNSGNTPEALSAGFDIVIGNPPYDVYEGKKKNEIKDILADPVYEKCKGGRINAYELFLAKIYEITKAGGIICQLFQNSFLADNAAKILRIHYLRHTTLLSIDSFPERDDPNKRLFRNAKMSVCILTALKRGSAHYTFPVRFWREKEMRNKTEVNYRNTDIDRIDPVNWTILQLREEEKEIISRYYALQKTYADSFRCLEGELNMTFHKKYMNGNAANPLIIKGAQVQRYTLTGEPSQGKIAYLDENAYLRNNRRSKKSRHHRKPRIVMQGISGVNDPIRIIASYVDAKVYCANSCNYIIAQDESPCCSLYSLLGIFNSKLTNWVFKKSSTNSNVNCYEVNNLRLPDILNKSTAQAIEYLVTYLLRLRRHSPIQKESAPAIEHFETILNALVYELYFPKEFQKAGIAIAANTGTLPAIKENTAADETLHTIHRIHKNHTTAHPLTQNIQKMKDQITEIRIIEETTTRI